MKIIVDEGGKQRSEAYVDLALLDLTVRRILKSHRSSIALWRIHRRFGHHKFGIDIVVEDDYVRTIEDDIRNDPLIIELTGQGRVLKVEAEHCSGGRSDVCDKTWTPAIQQAWPEFAQGCSSMLLQLTGQIREEESGGKKPEEILTMDLTDRLDVYRRVQDKINRLWQDEGAHAYLHHIHSFFAYMPFISVQTVQQTVFAIQ